jgi:hypothetical protein
MIMNGPSSALVQNRAVYFLSLLTWRLKYPGQV